MFEREHAGTKCDLPTHERIRITSELICQRFGQIDAARHGAAHERIWISGHPCQEVRGYTWIQRDFDSHVSIRIVCQYLQGIERSGFTASDDPAHRWILASSQPRQGPWRGIRPFGGFDRTHTTTLLNQILVQRRTEDERSQCHLFEKQPTVCNQSTCSNVP